MITSTLEVVGKAFCGVFGVSEFPLGAWASEGMAAGICELRLDFAPQISWGRREGVKSERI